MNKISISIVIPVRDRLQSLCKCLDSIALQECSIELEVIVVDDGSNEEIPDISKDYQFNLRIIRQVPLGIAAARNRGIQEAKGDLLFFLDSDCLLLDNSLYHLVQSYKQQTEFKAFQLRLIGNKLSSVGKMEHLRLFTTQQLLLEDNGQIKYLNTCGFAIRREVIDDCEIFSPALRRGEDTCLLKKLSQKGNLPYYLKNSIVEHHPQSKFLIYILRHFIIGYHNYLSHIRLRNTNIRLSFAQKLILLKKMFHLQRQENIHVIYPCLVLFAYLFEILGRMFYLILGTRHSRSQLLTTVVDRIEENEIIHKVTSCAALRKGLFVTYLTAWTLVLSQKDREFEFRKCLSSADIIYSDGMGVVLTAFLSKFRKLKKVTLHNFYPKLFQEISNRRLRIALVGGVQGLAEEAAVEIKKLAPNANICLCHTGYLQSRKQEIELREKLIQRQAQIVFVGMSQPIQEKWINKNREFLPNTVFYCVGAFFEFISNKEPLLPNSLKIIRVMGLEWLWRLYHSPKKLYHRYIWGLPYLCLLIIYDNLLRLGNIFKPLKKSISKDI